MRTKLRSSLKKILGYHSWNSDEDQQRLIPDVKTIFDVGANIGQTAKSYRQLFPLADIWSFEPYPESYTRLTQALSGPRFHPLAVALSDQVGTTQLNIGSGTVTNSLFRRAGDTGTAIEIRTETLDHFCAADDHKIQSIDILKVDVEGAEERVFRGAQAMFARGAIRSVFVEVYFDPVYEGMPLMWNLHTQLQQAGFRLHGLYSLNPGSDGRLSFGNALYLHV